MSRAVRVLILAVSLLPALSAFAQTTGRISSAVTGAPAERLTTLPQLASIAAAPAASAGAEMTIQWDTVLPPAANPLAVAASGPFQVLGSRAVADTAPFERAPQLSEDRLVVVAIDARGSEIGWQLVADPTLVRGEMPDASGTLRGQTFRRPVASFVVTVPRGSGIVELRIYKPRWTGSAFAIDALGTVTVPGDAR